MYQCRSVGPGNITTGHAIEYLSGLHVTATIGDGFGVVGHRFEIGIAAYKVVVKIQVAIYLQFLPATVVGRQVKITYRIMRRIDRDPRSTIIKRPLNVTIREIKTID